MTHLYFKCKCRADCDCCVSGRRAAARRRRGARAGAGCDCDPLLARLSEAVARDRRQIVTQIQASSSRLHSRLDSLERRTRHEVRLPLDNYLTIKSKKAES